ncbi:transglutaminase domain-containing protein [Actinobacillus equuli]|nr:transglutaminase domain-containing protein [Actinobacillus equuli]
MGFNHARDFDLYPQPELTPINNFGYPYAEVGGDPLNSFDAKSLVMSLSQKNSNKHFLPHLPQL